MGLYLPADLELGSAMWLALTNEMRVEAAVSLLEKSFNRLNSFKKTVLHVLILSANKIDRSQSNSQGHEVKTMKNRVTSWPSMYMLRSDRGKAWCALYIMRFRVCYCSLVHIIGGKHTDVMKSRRIYAWTVEKFYFKTWICDTYY